MGRIANSIEIIKASWAVLRKDKGLAWLPVLSGLSTVVTAALFLSGFLLVSTRNPITDELQPSAVGYVLAFAMYLVLAIITMFFNAALISAANERMSGGDPTVNSALGGATARFGKILPWALVSATVSVIIRSIQERAGIVGRIIGTIAGVAWSLLTFLVLPIIVIEGLSVGEALKRSGSLFKATWGEQVVGNAAIGLLGVAALLAAAPIVLLAWLTGIAALGLAVTAVAVVWMLGVWVVCSAMSGIFQTALYHFASTGEVPGGFTPAQLSGAFRPKTRTSAF